MSHNYHDNNTAHGPPESRSLPLHIRLHSLLTHINEQHHTLQQTLIHTYSCTGQKSHFLFYSLSVFMPVNQLLWFCIFKSVIYHWVMKLHLLNIRAFSQLLELLSRALLWLCFCMWLIEYSIILLCIRHGQGLNKSEEFIKGSRQI